MRKVLVDRELLERTVKHLEWDGDGSQTVMQYAQQGDSLANELMDCIARPAEAEGVDRWNGLKLAAEVAEEDGPWDPRVGLTDCEAAFAKSASPAVVLELIAALSAVTAERDRLQDQVKVLQSDANSWQSGYDKGRRDGTKHRQSEVDQLSAEAEALRSDALIGTDAYRATVYVLRRAACDELFGVAKLQRIFLLDWPSAERLLKEMVRRGDVEQCASHGWKFTDAAMAAKEA